MILALTYLCLAFSFAQEILYGGLFLLYPQPALQYLLVSLKLLLLSLPSCMSFYLSLFC